MSYSTIRTPRRSMPYWLQFGVVCVLAACEVFVADAQADMPVSTDTITVLYRRESESAPTRQTPAVQTALLALESEFLQRGFRVMQPSAEAYAAMDKGQSVIVTFAPDAGFSLVFSAYGNSRPVPGQEAAIAEVRLQARVFVGRNILVADEGRSQMFTRADAGNKEFGERRAMELAAKRAAADLADKASRRLKSLSAAQITAMVQTTPNVQSVTTEDTRPALSATPATATPDATGATAAAAMSALPPPRQRWALLVGVSNYSSVRTRLGFDVDDLPGVAVDIPNLKRTLVQTGFPAENIIALQDERATSGNLRQEFRKLVTKVRADDIVVIAVSAHGIDKDFNSIGFGMPVLADYDNKDPNALDFWEMQSLIGNLPAQRIVWMIDTCYSGGATHLLPRVEVSARGIKVQAGTVTPDINAVTLDGSKDFAVVTASRPDEVSQDLGPRGGLFTATLVEAVNADRGASTLESLFKERIQPKVISASQENCRRGGCPSPQQTPMLAFRGRGNLIRF